MMLSIVFLISVFGEGVSARQRELIESVRATSAEKILIAIKFFPRFLVPREFVLLIF
jgi:hypothetical protein